MHCKISDAAGAKYRLVSLICCQVQSVRLLAYKAAEPPGPMARTYMPRVEVGSLVNACCVNSSSSPRCQVGTSSVTVSLVSDVSPRSHAAVEARVNSVTTTVQQHPDKHPWQQTPQVPTLTVKPVQQALYRNPPLSTSNIAIALVAFRTRLSCKRATDRCRMCTCP